MTGKLYIDDKDAYSEYGIFITEGGFNELLAFPPLKEVESNNWPEEDGVEVDLSSPRLNMCEFSLKFATNRAAKVDALLELLCERAYHVFDFRDIGRTFTLRLVAQSAFEVIENLSTFALRFANDFPHDDNFSYTDPVSGMALRSGCELDGRDLAQYGVLVLQGSDTDIRKSPAVKPNLLQNIKSRHGAIYDEKMVFFQTREVTLNCLMRAATIPEFWHNYDALLYDLIRPGEHSLYLDKISRQYSCYYKSCSTSQFYHRNGVWFEFDLKLEFINPGTGVIKDFVLATEDGKVVLTPDGIYAIDLK